MCKSFEVISGKETKGDKSMLDGLTKMYRNAGRKVAIVSIPVEIMEIDTRYQTESRTERDLHYLTANWDENKLLPLIGVPHWEEGKVYLVDGYGRWIASQIVDREKYKELDVMLIFSAPKNEDERLKFEAKLYAFQNKQVSKMTPIQKHGAMLILHDKATEILDTMQKKYDLKFYSKGGCRGESVVGSYTDLLALCSIDDGKAAEFVLDICQNAGFDRKQNGYSRYIMRSLKDIYKLYAKNRTEIKEFLSNKFRSIEPLSLKAEAMIKYPVLDYRTAVSLYVEDIIVAELGLEQSRKVSGSKVSVIKKEIA